MPNKSSKEKKSVLKFERDLVSIIETNVDDVTGEILSRTIERLVAEGALDATCIPFTGKKGRPGITVRVTCEKGSVEKFAEILVEETGTLGVKTTDYERLIVPREVLILTVKIGSNRHAVPVKVTVQGRSKRFKAEYADVVKIAEKEDLPVREVLDVVSAEAMKQLR